MKPRIALIDGQPFSRFKDVLIVNNTQVSYSWDSDFYGVPEFRIHSDKMIQMIRLKNKDAEILVFPFYPKYESTLKNLRLLANNIEQAIDNKCTIICICLEVIKGKNIPLSLRAALKRAWKNDVIIGVSAGNDAPFSNPLIHVKYTIPIIGTAINGKIPDHLEIKPTTKVFGFSMFGGMNEKPDRINCSIATARFCGYLSTKIHHLVKSKKDSSFKQIVSILRDESILESNGLYHIPKV